MREKIEMILGATDWSANLARQLLAFSRRQVMEMKVFYMSGYPDEAIIRHGILGEGANLIQKPFSLEALVSKVREALDQEK
ncbi:MAG: hypothetical protein FJ117_11675 [Deltaproteobacteria bacterium]|nr:hypothetical protein [Deltaproteobacteria bacterium]